MQPDQETQGPLSLLQAQEQIAPTPLVVEVGTEHIVNPEEQIRAYTFAEAAALPRTLRDDTIAGIITEKLITPSGEEAFGIKHWLDRSLPSPAERAISKDPELIANLHDDAADLITRNLRIATSGIEEPGKNYLREQKAKFFSRLETDKQVFRTVAHEARTSGPRTTRLNGADEFIGFGVTTREGNKDLLDIDTKVPGIRPNIQVQREVSGVFIHWQTDARTKERVHGNPGEELTKRIYLNPEVTEIVGTFETLMQALNEAGIDAKGKMLVKANEAIAKNAGDKVEDVRADSIVLALSDKDADAVLDLVLSLYRDKPEIFEGRPTPKIPAVVAPGIAIGEEPGEEGQSLTTSRAELLAATAREVREGHGIQQGAVTPAAINEFRSRFAINAARSGISAHNLAFAS